MGPGFFLPFLSNYFLSRRNPAGTEWIEFRMFQVTFAGCPCFQSRCAPWLTSGASSLPHRSRCLGTRLTFEGRDLGFAGTSTLISLSYRACGRVPGRQGGKKGLGGHEPRLLGGPWACVPKVEDPRAEGSHTKLQTAVTARGRAGSFPSSFCSADPTGERLALAAHPPHLAAQPLACETDLGLAHR